MITSIYPNPVTIGTVDKGIDIPVNKWWGIQFGAGDEGAWQNSANRVMDRVVRFGAELGAEPYGAWGKAALDEYFGPEYQTMSAEDATKAYGIEGALKFDHPIREVDARARNKITLSAMEREEWIGSKKHNAISWRGISGFGAQVAGQMSNPLDFGLSILPIFGAEKVGVQAAAKVGWRQSLKFGADLPLTGIGQRGALTTFKAAGFAAKYPLFTESVLNGAASSAVGELATYFDQRSLQEETNYLGNVLVGAASSGAFHLGTRLLGRLLEPAARALHGLTPETHEAAARRATTAAEHGERITPDADGPLAHAGADENVMRGVPGAFIGPFYHGSPDFKGEKFSREHLGKETGISRGGFSFTDDADLASAFTREGVDADQGAVDLANAVMREMGSRLESKTTKHSTYKNAADLPEFNVRNIDDSDAFREFLRELADGLPEDLRSKMIEASMAGAGSANPRLIHAYIRNAEVIDVGGKKVWVVKNPEDILIKRSQTPEEFAAEREARVQSFLESQDPKAKAERQQRVAQQESSQAAKENKPSPKGDKWSKAIGDMEKEKAQLDAEATELETQLKKELAEEQGDSERVSKLDVELKKLKEASDLQTKVEQAAIDCLLKGPNA